MFGRSLTVFALALAAHNPLAAEAASISGQIDRVPTTTSQLITVLGGTPLNPGPGATSIVEGDGFVIWSIADEDEVAAEIPFEIIQAEFAGTNPLGSFVLTSVMTVGTISNVVKSDASGDRSSFVSGELQATGQFVRDITSGPFEGLRLFTVDPVVYTSTVNGLPFPPGTTLVSPEPLDVFVNLGAGNIKIAESTNRVVTIVPEPATIPLVVLAVGQMLCCAFRQRPPHAAYG